VSPKDWDPSNIKGLLYEATTNSLCFGGRTRKQQLTMIHETCLWKLAQLQRQRSRPASTCMHVNKLSLLVFELQMGWEGWTPQLFS